MIQDQHGREEELSALEAEEKTAQQQLSQTTGDRLKRIQLEKQVSKIHKEWMKRQENLFFAQMQPNMELEEKIKQFDQNQKFTPYLFKDELFEGKFSLDNKCKVLEYRIRTM